MNDTLTPKDVAGILKITSRTLRTWRAQGFGPVWVRWGNRGVRYLRDDVLAWLQENRMTRSGGQ